MSFIQKAPFEKYRDEFCEFSKTMVPSERCPLNTEMLALWTMIRETKPELFVESGAYKAYSARYICEALSKNEIPCEFMTIGFDLDGCLAVARKNLIKYPFAQVVNADSRIFVSKIANPQRRAAFFIDGPKGPNMYPLFKELLKRFSQVSFVAVHDCNIENGSNNQFITRNFFEPQFAVEIVDNEFQEHFKELDAPLVGIEAMQGWVPYQHQGVRGPSYGTQTAFVQGWQGAISTSRHTIPRWWRTVLRPALGGTIRSALKRA